MPALIDLTGSIFGSLTAIKRAANRGKRTMWLCLCVCGTECEAQADHLRRGDRVSCGCKPGALKHGLGKHPLYLTWNLMMARCYNCKHEYYQRYGGRGITVQPSWHDCTTFIADILRLLGPRPAGPYQLDREDNDGDYREGNVRWVTRTENGRNRHDNILVVYKGELMCVTRAAELSGINQNALRQRVYKGKVGDALFKPLRIQR